MFPSSSIFAIFIFSFVLAIGAVASPGPISTAIVSQAPRNGWQVGPLIATGHSVLELIIVLLITVGLTTVLAHPSVQTAISLLGGLLLVWMGGSMIWQNWRGNIHLPVKDDEIEPTSTQKLIGLGMLATISNPFWYAWWVTIATGYIAQAKATSINAVTAFYLGHITADYTWDTFLSAVLGGGRRWMTDTVYRLLLIICGIFFIYLGSTFLSKGIISLK
jgi:threonine/homoserine/homoserine lactone efflux protein